MRMKKGADVNAKTENESTALIEAVDEGRLDVVRILLDYDADFTVTDWKGQSVLKIAETSGRKQIVKLLKDRGANE